MLALQLLARAVDRGAGPNTQRNTYALAEQHRGGEDKAAHAAALDALEALTEAKALDPTVRAALQRHPLVTVRSNVWARTDVTPAEFAAYIATEKSKTAVADLLGVPSMTPQMVQAAATPMTKTLAVRIVELHRHEATALVLADAIRYLCHPNGHGTGRGWSKLPTDVRCNVVRAAAYTADAPVLRADTTLPTVVRLAAMANPAVPMGTVAANIATFAGDVDRRCRNLVGPAADNEQTIAVLALALLAARPRLSPEVFEAYRPFAYQGVMFQAAQHWRPQLEAAEEKAAAELAYPELDTTLDGDDIGELLEAACTAEEVTAVWEKMTTDQQELFAAEVAEHLHCDTVRYHQACAADGGESRVFRYPDGQLWTVQDEALFKELVGYDVERMLLHADRDDSTLPPGAQPRPTRLRWFTEALIESKAVESDAGLDAWTRLVKVDGFPQDLADHVPTAAVLALFSGYQCPHWLVDAVLDRLDALPAGHTGVMALLTELTTDAAPLGQTLVAAGAAATDSPADTLL